MAALRAAAARSLVGADGGVGGEPVVLLLLVVPGFVLAAAGAGAELALEIGEGAEDTTSVWRGFGVSPELVAAALGPVSPGLVGGAAAISVSSLAGAETAAGSMIGLAGGATSGVLSFVAAGLATGRGASWFGADVAEMGTAGCGCTGFGAGDGLAARGAAGLGAGGVLGDEGCRAPCIRDRVVANCAFAASSSARARSAADCACLARLPFSRLFGLLAAAVCAFCASELACPARAIKYSR